MKNVLLESESKVLSGSSDSKCACGCNKVVTTRPGREFVGGMTPLFTDIHVISLTYFMTCELIDCMSQ